MRRGCGRTAWTPRPITGDYVLGTVDLLALRSQALGKEALEEACQVADAVAAALLPTRDMIITGAQAPAWEPEEVVRAHWFDTARAVGALATRRRITPENALALIRAEAFRTGKSLSDITRDILHGP
ncbi:ANTAR domain-containing protein [Streptomyces coeruleorubidus]|uniref:ANTAR domain-containing protein n=1 Tax=Streptomyces coeruleorubidus TaxID=116188 RepID=UPI003816E937